MFSTLALATIALSATVVSAGNGKVDAANFDAFKEQQALQADADRLAALTSGTPITTFCVDAAGKALAGAALTTCQNDLAKEIVTLQTKLVDAFFAALVKQFNVFGTPFEANQIQFDNNAECVRFINQFVTNKALVATEAEACSNQCVNQKLAADCLQIKIRDLLRAEQAKVGGNVFTALDNLDLAHLAVFDKSLVNDKNAVDVAKQNEFKNISKDADRLKQQFDGLILGQIAQTVAAIVDKGYVSYNDKVTEKNADEVQILLNKANVELLKTAGIVDAQKNFNALDEKNEDEVEVQRAIKMQKVFDLLDARKEKVDAPVIVFATVSKVDAAKFADVQAAFKKALGPETEFFQPKSNDKTTFDVLIGVDQSEISSQDSEFSFVCVQEGVQCDIKQDVHRPLFDIAQKVVKDNVHHNPPAGGYDAAPAPPAHVGVDDSASTLFVAAGAILASLAMFL